MNSVKRQRTRKSSTAVLVSSTTVAARRNPSLYKTVRESNPDQMVNKTRRAEKLNEAKEAKFNEVEAKIKAAFKALSK